MPFPFSPCRNPNTIHFSQPPISKNASTLVFPLPSGSHNGNSTPRRPAKEPKGIRASSTHPKNRHGSHRPPAKNGIATPKHPSPKAIIFSFLTLAPKPQQQDCFAHYRPTMTQAQWCTQSTAEIHLYARRDWFHCVCNHPSDRHHTWPQQEMDFYIKGKFYSKHKDFRGRFGEKFWG